MPNKDYVLHLKSKGTVSVSKEHHYPEFPSLREIQLENRTVSIWINAIYPLLHCQSSME